ncbi:MAG: maleylpyruvate isomerase family mycothiol-dependent enzyme [Actinomycetota bacterium]
MGSPLFDHAAYCDAVAVEAERFVDAVRGIDPEARVPTCPEWSAADLMRHLGTVHRWAGNQVAVLTPKRIPSDEMDLAIPAEPSGFPDWLAEGGRFVVDTLRASDPNVAMWAWGADQHVRFWSRRMLHETAVHRADAEFTAGSDPHIAREVAVDGIDEFLENLPMASRWNARVGELLGSGERLAFRATDHDAAWTITLEPNTFIWDHDGKTADVTVEGTASDLALFVYGRVDPADHARFTVEGDRALLAFWRERSSL